MNPIEIAVVANTNGPRNPTGKTTASQTSDRY
jgi:hypothetical protein